MLTPPMAQRIEHWPARQTHSLCSKSKPTSPNWSGLRRRVRLCIRELPDILRNYGNQGNGYGFDERRHASSYFTGAKWETDGE